MKTFSLALRNLLRNRRRSLTTLLAMIVGAGAVLIFGGYNRNVAYGLQTGFVASSGHLQVQHKNYFLYGTGNPIAYGIADYERIISTIKADPVLAPMLTVVTPTLHLGGIAGNFAAGVSRTVLGAGVVVADQNVMSKWNDYHFSFTPKNNALTGTSADAVVIGNGLARVLQLCGPLHVKDCQEQPTNEDGNGKAAPADISALSSLEAPHADANPENATHIEMLAATSHGAPNVASLNVVKAEDIGVKELDDIFMTMHLDQAQHLLYGAAAPQVTAIVVQLQHTNQMDAAKARLNQLLSTTFKDEPLEVQEFTTLNPSYGQIIGMFAALFSFIAILIGVIVLFTVGNTMSMAVVERTVEIGTLRAIGLRRSGIRRLFVCEGFLLGVLGAASGIGIALLLAYLINHAGITWMPPGRVEPVPLNVRVWGETRLIVGTAIGLMLVAMFSALWPANRAARMNIVDALRHV